MIDKKKIGKAEEIKKNFWKKIDGKKKVRNRINQKQREKTKR